MSDASPIAPGEAASPETKPCAAGIVFALSQEAGGTVDRIEGRVTSKTARFTIEEGAIAGRLVATVVSGVGSAAAVRAAETLVVGHRPEWLISAGFAGALVPELRRNDLFIADEIVAAGSSPEPVALAPRLQWEGFGGAVHLGRLVTAEAIAATAEAKRSLAAEHAAMAVDMESLAVARFCRAAAIPFAAIRVISDESDETLPTEAVNLVKQTTFAGKLGALAGAVFQRPTSVKDLYRLKENALVASDRLADFLAYLLRSKKNGAAEGHSQR